MISLMKLLCGCVVDGDQICGEFQGKQVIIECPICKVTFSLDDFRDFAAENKEEIQVHLLLAISTPRPLIEWKGQAFEVYEICDCGYPIVKRTRNTVEKPHHLRVSPVDTRRLRD